MKESVISIPAELAQPGPDTVNQYPFFDIAFQSHGKHGTQAAYSPVNYSKEGNPAKESPGVLQNSCRKFRCADAGKYIVNGLCIQRRRVCENGFCDTDGTDTCYKDNFKRRMEDFFFSRL